MSRNFRGRERQKSVDWCRPLEPAEIKARPLIVTRNRTGQRKAALCCVLERSHLGKLGRYVSGDEKSKYSGKSNHGTDTCFLRSGLSGMPGKGHYLPTLKMMIIRRHWLAACLLDSNRLWITEARTRTHRFQRRLQNIVCHQSHSSWERHESVVQHESANEVCLNERQGLQSYRHRLRRQSALLPLDIKPPQPFLRPIWSTRQKKSRVSRSNALM